MLTERYSPTTPLRGMHFKTSVVKWETSLFTFERDSGEKLSDKLKTAMLLIMMPQDLQDTLVQHTDKFDNDRVARDIVITVAESKTLLKDPDAMDIGPAECEWRGWQGYEDDVQEEYADVDKLCREGFSDPLLEIWRSRPHLFQGRRAQASRVKSKRR